MTESPQKIEVPAEHLELEVTQPPAEIFVEQPAITVETVSVPIVLSGAAGAFEVQEEAVEIDESGFAMPMPSEFHTNTGPVNVVPVTRWRDSVAGWGWWLPVATGVLIGVLGLVGGALIAFGRWS